MNSPSKHGMQGFSFLTAGILLSAVVLSQVFTPTRLLASAPVIRSIHFERIPIFTQDDYDRLPDWPLRLMDAIHVDTKTKFLRRELTFAVGDTLNPEDLRETERRLRALGFLRSADVFVSPGSVHSPGVGSGSASNSGVGSGSANNPGVGSGSANNPGVGITPSSKDSVDVIVRTRETWTTSPGIRFSSYQGSVFFGASLTERNLLGMGRSLSARYDTNPDRSGWSLEYTHPFLLTSENRVAFRFANTSDGSLSFLQLSRPWTSIDASWSYDLSWNNSTQRPRYSINQIQYLRPLLDDDTIRASVLWRLKSGKNNVFRLGPKIWWDRLRYHQEDSLSIWTTYHVTHVTDDFPADAPENREMLAMGVELEWNTKNYATLRYVNLMGREEDIPMGHETTFGVGYAASAIAGDVEGVYLELNQRYNIHSRHLLHRFTWTGSGLIEDGKGRNLQTLLDYRAQWELQQHLRLASGLMAGWGERLDRQRPFTMGSDSGLRSAGYREFTGDRLVRANLELRWVKEHALMNLVVPGMVAFADFGNTWYERESNFRWDEIHGALGFGVRLAAQTSTFGYPVRLDVAWPVAKSTGAFAPVFTVGTRQAF